MRAMALALMTMAIVAGCAASAQPSRSPAPLPSASGPTFSVRNGTSIAVTIVVNGAVLETVPAGVTEDPVRVAPPTTPWVVEARSPSGRVLATMTVGANANLSANSGRGAMEDLACGRIMLWAGSPTTGGPTFIPDPSKPCD